MDEVQCQGVLGAPMLHPNGEARRGRHGPHLKRKRGGYMHDMRWARGGRGQNDSHRRHFGGRFLGRRGKRPPLFRANNNMIRFNRGNVTGLIMVTLTQVSIATTVIAMAWLTLVSPSNFGRVQGGIVFGAFAMVSALSMWSHAAVALSDPGHTTEDAIPILESHGEVAVAPSSVPIPASGSPVQATLSNVTPKKGSCSLYDDGTAPLGKRQCTTGVVGESAATPTAPPAHAVPAEAVAIPVTVVCSRCNYYKPPCSHHCRVCRRCTARMDHHCPITNNCIGAANQKVFLLFLFYNVTASLMALAVVIYYATVCILPALSGCVEYTRRAKAFSWFTLVFGLVSLSGSGSMLVYQIHGIKSGVGTVDRMKQIRKGSTSEVLENNLPVPLADIMGQGNKIWWLIPTSPEWGPDYPPRSWGFSIQRQPTAPLLTPEHESSSRHLHEPHHSVAEIL